MSDKNLLVKHVFYDPETKKIYTLHVLRDSVEQIQTDKDFASQMFYYAKSCSDDAEKGFEGDNDQQPSTSHSQNEVIISSEESNDVFDNKISTDQAHSATNENENRNVLYKRTSKQSASKKCAEESYIWSYEDSKSLILSYGSHPEDLDHPVRSKFVWNNITNDLVSQGFNVDKKTCQRKWNNLLRTYKSKRDKTGSEPNRFLFYDLMNDVIGNKPSNSSSYTLSSFKTKDNNNCRKKNCTVQEQSDSDEAKAMESKKSKTECEKQLKLKNNPPKNQKTRKVSRSKKKKNIDEDYECKISREETKLAIQERRLEIDSQKLEIKRMRYNILKEHIDYKKNINKE